MAVVFPSAEISQRWNGSLQARLTRAPLEAFLRSQGFAPARVGVAQDTDNVTRAAVHMIESAIARLSAPQLTGTTTAFCGDAIAGDLSCIVTKSLASMIEKPPVWRIAALLSTAQLLTPRIGLTEAAVAAAAYVRRFEREGGRDSALDHQIAQAAISALQDGMDDFVKVSALLVSRLSVPSDGSSGDSVVHIEASIGRSGSSPSR